MRSTNKESWSYFLWNIFRRSGQFSSHHEFIVIIVDDLILVGDDILFFSKSPFSVDILMQQVFFAHFVTGQKNIILHCSLFQRAVKKQ